MTNISARPTRDELPELPQPYFWNEASEFCLFKSYKTKASKIIVVSWDPIFAVKFLTDEWIQDGEPTRMPRVVIRQWTARWGWEEYSCTFFTARSLWRATDCHGASVSPWQTKLFHKYVCEEFQAHHDRVTAAYLKANNNP